ncbi:DUF1419 domain-containing protein [Mesorhizobium sp.]|uniref:DUF1419 domain-containing protein n=1 Tax=Mesorhizobium sp. TaxID=1871066 RepID=UPI00257D2E9F|nr:DUF1419 domain-containing protein [Mesorhizobium sp.]
MLQLPSALNDRRQHYLNLNQYKMELQNADWMLGKFWQIDREIYDEFLNLLPPIYCAGGFRLCERLTGDIAATYLRVGSDYWCGFTDLRDTQAGKMVAHIARLLV